MYREAEILSGWHRQEKDLQNGTVKTKSIIEGEFMACFQIFFGLDFKLILLQSLEQEYLNISQLRTLGINTSKSNHP
jgi:hypothetical protein